MAECRVLEKKNGSKNVLTIFKARSPVTEHAIVEKEQFIPFILQGYVSLSENGEKVPVEILRDTGAAQSILVEGILPLEEDTATGNNVQIQGVELGVVSVPLHTIFINSDIVTGRVTVGIRPTLSIKGISLILGNDLAGGKVMPDLQLVEDPEPNQDEKSLETSIFPACVVTRAAAKKACENHEQHKISHDTSDHSATERCNSTTAMQSSHLVREDNSTRPCPSVKREQLLEAQQHDAELVQLAKEAVSEEEMTKHAHCYYLKSGILMRKWRPPDAPALEE